MSRTVEHHGDGSYTERYGDGTSITHNSDHSVRESVRYESNNPFSILIPGGCTKDVQVIRNSNGCVTDVKSAK